MSESGDNDNFDSEASSMEESTSGFPFKEEAKLIPFRMQQVTVNYIFLVASIALILDFAALQDMVHDGRFKQFDELCNWFGVLSCICWLGGFIILVHWLHSVGATSMGLTGAYMKVIASVFFNLQPMTGTMNDAMLGGPAGLWWSNLTGILFFHVGNCVSCLDFYLHTPPGASKKKGWLYHGNLPITGMWTYQMATWFLVGSNFMACSFNGQFDWAPVSAMQTAPVYICQFLGSFGLLLGTLIFMTWADAFTGIANPPLA